MADGSSYGGLTTMLVVQGANIGLLAKALQQQKQTGQAALQLIDAGAPAPQRGAPAPQQGAPEPGKGSLVDVTA